MAGFGAGAYTKVAVESRIGTADPHRLILMLFDGALESIRLAEAQLAARQIAAKCAAVTKASRIVNEGLRASVDRGASPELGGRLVALYDYVLLRLLQANVTNDAARLREAHKVLADLRDTWAQIAPRPAAPVATPAPAAGVRTFAAAAARPVPAATRHFTAAA